MQDNNETRSIPTRLLNALAKPFGGIDQLEGKTIEQVEHAADTLADIVEAMDSGDVPTTCLQETPDALADLFDPDVDERRN